MGTLGVKSRDCPQASLGWTPEHNHNTPTCQWASEPEPATDRKKSTLDGLPNHLPALIRAQRMQEKASNVGFDWPEWRQAWEKLEEEISEFKKNLESTSKEEQADEFGDLLFSLVNVARYFELTAEDSLRLTNKKFEYRFRYIEKKLKEKGRSIKDSNLEEMDTYWEESKHIVNNT